MIEPTETPFTLFGAWLAEAETGEVNDANAMTLATATADGFPSARIVLLKGYDDRGFVFYTNFDSRKGAELLANPKSALLFHWKTLRRQIRIEGLAEPVSAAEADDYFNSRPRGSRLGAWASDQSRPLPKREELERRVQEATARYEGAEVPRPAHWSGFRMVPRRFEFWQDMPYRLHDRLVYERAASGNWTIGRLFP